MPTLIKGIGNQDQTKAMLFEIAQKDPYVAYYLMYGPEQTEKILTAQFYSNQMNIQMFSEEFSEVFADVTRAAACSERLEEVLSHSAQNANLQSNNGTRRFRAIDGLRSSRYNQLSNEQIEYVKQEFKAIGGDPNQLRFNTGSQTGYIQESNTISICGDVFPDELAAHPRSVMSVRATLAHELYGHGAYPNTNLGIGTYSDEVRASYSAAKNAPNLSDTDRYYLVQDAMFRAREAGYSLTLDSFMKKALGYEDYR